MDEYNFPCPYCNGENVILLDISDESNQRMITDCEVCCQPIVIKIRKASFGMDIRVERENE